jgi:hypothetical protein
MAAVDDLSTAINQIAAQIKDITANPKPDYSVNGQSISWASYLSMLTEQITKLQQAQQSIAGPYQRISRIRP